jgi:uncharacterized membrane protein YfhO
MENNTLKKKGFFQKIFSDNAYCWISLMCTALIMLLVYFCYELFPFGEVTILRMDLYHQYGPLFAELYDRVTQFKSLIYSWNTGLGGPFLGNFFNYLASPSMIFMLLFGHENMPEAIAAMILAKGAFAAGSFTLYLKKSQNRHDFTTAAFGVLYAMCGWFVAYYWNVMWVDAMVYFPMVMYGIERIINRRKPSVYIAFLTLTLLSNYYMGYMTCIFSVIYFLVYYFSNYNTFDIADNAVYYFDSEGNKKYTKLEKAKGSIFLRSGFTFALGSLSAGCLSAFALLPTYLILKSCSATSGTWPSGYKIYFSIFDFLANHLASVDPTIRSSGDDVLPNVFCGIGTIILVPLYIFSKRINLKEKIASVFTLGIIYFSFNLNYLNYIMHGFHFPNDLPYRFSYMYCFVLLVMAFKAFKNLNEYTGRQILGSGVAVVFMIILVQELGSKNVEDITILLSLIFAVTYTLVFYMLKDTQKQKTAIAVILLCCVVAEIACSNTDRYSMSQTKSSYTADYDDFRAIKSQLDELEGGDDSYRMELTYNRARMDPAWFGYNGISTFSSMAYEKMANMQSDLGLYSNYINSYTYYMQTPIYNMMNSLKYIVDNDDTVTVTDDYYSLVASNESFSAYKNNYYLTIGMAVSSDLKNWYSAYTNPFLTQGEWAQLSTGVEGVFESMDISDVRYYNIEEIETGFETGDVYFSKQGSGEAEMTVVLTVPETRHSYLFVDSDNFEEITVSKGDDIKVQSIDEPYILDLGIVTPEDTVEVTISLDEDTDTYNQMDFFAYYVNDDKLNECYDTLKANELNVETFDETYIKGTVTADTDCMMFTSIPYDKGWTVKIDGVEISEDDYIALNDAYLCFNLPEGEHTIELSFKQRGLALGAGVALATLVILIIVAIIVKKKRPVWNAKYQQKCEKAQMDYENLKEQMRLEAERIRQMELQIEEIPLDDIANNLPSDENAETSEDDETVSNDEEIESSCEQVEISEDDTTQEGADGTEETENEIISETEEDAAESDISAETEAAEDSEEKAEE